MAVIITNKVPQSRKPSTPAAEPYDIETVPHPQQTILGLRELGMMFANVSLQGKVSVGGSGMKRLLVLVLVITVLVITGTFVSADGKTSATNNEFQSRQQYRINGG